MSSSKKRRRRKSGKNADQQADVVRRVTQQSVRKAGLEALALWIVAAVLVTCLSVNLILAHYHFSHLHLFIQFYLAGPFAIAVAALSTWSWKIERKHLQNQAD